MFPSHMLRIKKIMFWAQQSLNFNVHMHGQALTIIAWENSGILRCHRWFPCKIMSEKQHRNSILMTRHYSDLGSASNRLKQISYTARPIRSTTQVWVVMPHQYGISALASRTSFRGETRGGIAKCWWFSQAMTVRNQTYMPVVVHMVSSTRSKAACAMNWLRCLWSSLWRFFLKGYSLIFILRKRNRIFITNSIRNK